MTLRDKEVMVCSACKRSSCWLGLFYCDEAKVADIEPMTVAELEELNLEHQSYWFRTPDGQLNRVEYGEYLTQGKKGNIEQPCHTNP